MFERIARSTRAWAVPTLALLGGAWAALPAMAAQECDKPGRLYVLGSVEDQRLFHCAPLRNASDPATLSFSEDYRADSWRLSVSGALAMLLSDGSGGARRDRISGLVLTTHPLAFYLEGNGTFGSAGSEGVFRLGLKSDLVFQNYGDGTNSRDIWLNGLTVTSALYRQFDLDGASGMGVKTTIRPVSTRAHMGTARQSEDDTAADPYFFWSPYLALDALWNDKAGDTSLSDNQDYIWAGLGADFTYVMPDVGPHGARMSLRLSHHVDLNSDLSATWGQASFATALNKARTAYFQATYSKGTDYRSLGKTDRLTIGLGLRF